MADTRCFRELGLVTHEGLRACLAREGLAATFGVNVIIAELENPLATDED